MRTIQKKIKFTKGMITSSLEERTDLPVYDSSAELIRNYVCTPYGGFRTRRGTKLIRKLDLADKLTFSGSNIFGTFENNNYVSSPLGEVQDGQVIGIFDLGSSIEDYNKNVSPTYNKNDMGYYKVRDSRNKRDIYKLFNGTKGAFAIGTWQGYWIQQEYPNPFAVKEYYIKADNAGSPEYPTSWKFQGSNNQSDWYDLDFRSGQKFGLGEEKKFQITLPKAYKYNRILFASGIVSEGNGELNGIKMTGAYNKPARSEVNIYLDNIRLDFEIPKFKAIFEETGYKLEARMTEVQVINQGKAFDGKLNVVGTVKEGKTEFYPRKDQLGRVYEVWFDTALYQYLPETPQDVQVSAIPPKCQIGISTSTDGINWSVDRKYEIKDVSLPRIKLQAYNCRFVRIRYFGKPLNTILRFDNLYAKSEFYKIIPFIYNTTQKNLIVLSEKKILIFEDNKLSKTINIVPELYFKNVRAVKYSQNEDVIIFTESGVKPRELRRTVNDWEFKEFPIKNIPFHNFAETKEETKTIGITPNYVSGAVTLTADNNVFTSASVGQQIDGNGGRYKITEYVNEKKVIGYTIIPFLNVEKITKWKLLTGWEKVWSESRGWPITCLFYQQRLWFGGSTQRPSTIWASRTGIYNDFNNAGNYDNDAINQDINTENQIVNLLSNRGLQIFTSGDEWTASEGSLTPNAFNVFKNTAAGSSINLIPKNLGGVTLFVEKNGKSLLSYVYDYNQAAYKTSNISILANLIAEPVDMEIDDNSSLDEGDYLYIVLKDGRMLITSINFEQEINAPSIFESRGLIQSVCNLINDTYLLENLNDQTYLVVIDDTQKTDLTISKFVTKEITGLDDFNGHEVYVYSKDQNFGKYYINNGTITLNKEANTDCNIGLVFNSELKSNEIAINGKSTGIRKRISKAVITTHDTDTIRLNGVIKHAEDNIFDFYAVTSYGKRVNFKIESEFERVEVLSILLNINYGVN